MKQEYLFELLSIAKQLDSRGLFDEASLIDKIAADILNFEEKVKELKLNREPDDKEVALDAPEGEVISLDDKREESRDIKIEEFVKKNLLPDSKVQDSFGEHDLADFAYNSSEELREYMIEVMPDKISDLYSELGDTDIEQLFEDILHSAEVISHVSKEDRPHYSEDVLFLVRAMKHYLDDYDFGV